jgi:hypothetical protein
MTWLVPQRRLGYLDDYSPEWLASMSEGSTTEVLVVYHDVSPAYDDHTHLRCTARKRLQTKESSMYYLSDIYCEPHTDELGYD